MYFEDRINNIAESSDLSEIARGFIVSRVKGVQGFRYKHNNQYFIFVEDSYQKSRLSPEVAIVNQSTNTQIDWIPTTLIDRVEALAKMFQIAINKNEAYYNHSVIVPIEYSQLRSITFMCACCGENFLGTPKYQAKFNFHEGVGYCHFCESKELRDKYQLTIQNYPKLYHRIDFSKLDKMDFYIKYHPKILDLIFEVFDNGLENDEEVIRDVFPVIQRYLNILNDDLYNKSGVFI